MLTQNDLQAIGKIINDTLDLRLPLIENKIESLETKLTKRADSLEIQLNKKTDSLGIKIGSLETKMGSFEEKLASVEKKLLRKIDFLDKKTNRGFKSVDKKLDVIINYFDYENIDIKKRLNRIENHLGLQF